MCVIISTYAKYIKLGFIFFVFSLFLHTKSEAYFVSLSVCLEEIVRF